MGLTIDWQRYILLVYPYLKPMSKALSLKLQTEVFEQMEKERTIPRNTYINRAIEFFNRLQRRRYLKKQLAKEAKIAYATSMEVLKEFEDLDDPIFE